MVATTEPAVRWINAAPGDGARRNRPPLAHDLAASRRSLRVEQRWDEALAGYEGVKTMTWDFERPSREIRALAQQSDFLVIDLLHPFRDDFRTSRQSHSWLHDGHWNRHGHAVAAEAVKDFLIQHRAMYNLN